MARRSTSQNPASLLASSSTPRKPPSPETEMAKMGTSKTADDALLIPPGTPRSDDKGKGKAEIITEEIPKENTEKDDEQVTGKDNGQGMGKDEVTKIGFHNTKCCNFCCLIVKKDLASFGTDAKDWFSKFEGKEEEWLEAIRGYVATIAGLIATMAFAGAIAPPGGVVSVALGDHPRSADESFNETVIEMGKTIFNSTVNATLHGGEAVLGIVFPSDYQDYLRWNSVSMYLSLIIFLMMMTGIALRHRFMVWLISMLLCVDVLAVGLVFSNIVSMTNPANIGISDGRARQIFKYVWFGSLGLFMVVLTFRMLFWFGTHLSQRTILKDEEAARGTNPPVASGGEAPAQAQVTSGEERKSVRGAGIKISG